MSALFKDTEFVVTGYKNHRKLVQATEGLYIIVASRKDTAGEFGGKVGGRQGS
jgi:DNA-binding cell septation regulator SpoVG